ncbi:MAG: glycoside hydrolase [Bacteroidaceae bacterium]|nr:glycoside hydrolase [Bacteroidaceae bacterium]
MKKILWTKRWPHPGNVTTLVWLCACLLISGLLVSCSKDDEPDDEPDAVEQAIKNMSLREKVGQLFFIRPESLDTTIHWSTHTELTVNPMQRVTETAVMVDRDYPVGGVILFAHNIDEESQLADFIGEIRRLKGTPLLCIDEEGGRVARIANNANFNVPKYVSMDSIGKTGDARNAYECGNTIGKYLYKYGFDIDFAPVADVNTNPENVVIGARAFSDDPQVAAPMVTNYLQGLKDAGITGCIKHFPGHGDTKNDTHTGYASSNKTWAQMLDCEMVTFKAGIRWGTELIMTAHIAAPNVTGSTVPSTMSSVILQDKLRTELGYNNIIVTDAMDMGAITLQYDAAAAAVGSIKAGVDIVLCPKDLIVAFEAVMDAVDNGTITEERINQSVRRILRLKQRMGHNL